MSKLNRLISMRNELKEMGNFENCLDGVIGEVYAMEKLGMIKTPAHTKGIDGHINNKSVQVKTKGGKAYRDSEHYIQINCKYEEKIDLLLMVQITSTGISHQGPFQRSICKGRLYNKGKSIRYYLNDLLKSINE